MNNKNRILSMTIVFTIAIALVGTNSAFAESEEKLREIAEESWNIKQEIQELKSESQTEQTRDEIRQLAETYKRHIHVLNEHGIPTIQQYEEDPNTWLVKRAEVVTEEPIASDKCAECQAGTTHHDDDNPQLKFMAGYSVPSWGTTWINYSQDSWSFVNAGESVSSIVDVDEWWNMDGFQALWVSGATNPAYITYSIDARDFIDQGVLMAQQPFEKNTQFLNSSQYDEGSLPLRNDVTPHSWVQIFAQPHTIVPLP